MVNKKANQKNLKYIREEFGRTLFFEGKYTTHLERAVEVKMSAGATQNSLYGLFPPLADVQILLDRERLGKLVTEEKGIDFKYYFDDQGRVIMIERFDPTSQYGDKLVSTIFVEYEQKRQIDVIFCKGRTEHITTVAQCKLDLFGRLIRYMECTCGVNDFPYVYRVMSLQHVAKTVKVRHTVYSVWQDGDETVTSFTKYLYKNGQLRQIP